MARIDNHPDYLPGETAWEGWTNDEVLFQRVCDAEGCQQGLRTEPAHFCPKCGGGGYLVRSQREVTQ